MTTLNGKKRSNDPRNHLLFEFLRFVRVLRPKAVMMENVPRISRTNKLRCFTRQLKRMGYTANAAVLDAAKYGVPQRRRRFILLAAKGAAPPFAPPVPSVVTVRAAIGRLPQPIAADPLHHARETRTKKIRALIRRIPKNGGSRAALGKRSQLKCHTRVEGFNDIYGRMAWNEVAPTITGGCCNPSKGRFLHPERNRCVTLREAALLQSFPSTYHFSLRRGKFAVAEMIGNALPPEFIRRHAEMVKQAIR